MGKAELPNASVEMFRADKSRGLSNAGPTTFGGKQNMLRMVLPHPSGLHLAKKIAVCHKQVKVDTPSPSYRHSPHQRAAARLCKRPEATSPLPMPSS